MPCVGHKVDEIAGFHINAYFSWNIPNFTNNVTATKLWIFWCLTIMYVSMIFGFGWASWGLVPTITDKWSYRNCTGQPLRPRIWWHIWEVHVEGKGFKFCSKCWKFRTVAHRRCREIFLQANITSTTINWFSRMLHASTVVVDRHLMWQPCCRSHSGIRSNNDKLTVGSWFLMLYQIQALFPNAIQWKCARHFQTV